MLRRMFLALWVLIALCVAGAVPTTIIPAQAQSCNPPSGWIEQLGQVNIGDIATFGPGCGQIQDGGLPGPGVIISVATPVTATTLQNAITLACASANAIVQIPIQGGLIDTTASSINIPFGCKAIILQGSGGITSGTPNGSLLTNTSAANDLFNVQSNGAVVFRDFAISTNVTKNAGTALIRLNNTSTGLSQQVIERMSINAGCNSVQIDNSFNSIVINNLITSFTCAGVVLTQPTSADQGNNVVAFNKIWDVNGTAGADSCILWHRGSGARLISNRCLGAFNYGLHVLFDGTFGNDGALIATGNTFEVQKLSGVFFERSAGALGAGTTIGQMIVSNNFIQTITGGNTGSINIAASGGSPWVQGAEILGNSIQITSVPAFNAAIEIDGCDQCNVSNNMIYVTGGINAGIRVSGTSTNVKLINNSNDGTSGLKYPAFTATTTIVDFVGAWTSYTPTLSCAAGALTTATATGRYQKNGRTVNVQIDIVDTANGTCATAINATLPFGAVTGVNNTLNGKEVALVGFQCSGLISNGTGLNLVAIRKYDATFPGANGNEIIVGGVYEAAQ